MFRSLRSHVVTGCALGLLPLSLTACPTLDDPPVDGGPFVDVACGSGPAAGGVAVGFPLAPGSYTVGQGNDGAFSHSGLNQFAYDFTVDVGTDVVAARGGTVVLVVDGFGPGGPDPALATAANFVVVDPGGGSFDSYFHLLADNIAVDVGDVVGSGDLLGLSGNSGFSSAPHLHFAVVDALLQSRPSCFAPGDQSPGDGDVVDAVDSPLADPVAPQRSLLAADTFADSGIVIDNDVVAFAIDGTLHVEGRVTDGNQRAAVFLSPAQGGDAVVQVLVDVDAGGAFVADLDASGFPGVMGLGMSSVDDDRRFGVDRLAPVVVDAR